MISLIAKASAADPRIPDNPTPGVIFTSIVIALMILFLVWVWYTNYGPGAEKNPNAAKYQK